MSKPAVAFGEMERERNLPGLKNMKRTVAVRLFTLNGCPLSTIRLAMMRVVSVFRKLPIATNSGAAEPRSQNHKKKVSPVLTASDNRQTAATLRSIANRAKSDKRTLSVISLSEQHARLRPKHDWPKDSRHARDAMPQVSLELVHVIRALAATAGVLAVYWVHAQAARPNAQYERILNSDK